MKKFSLLLLGLTLAICLVAFWVRKPGSAAAPAVVTEQDSSNAAPAAAGGIEMTSSVATPTALNSAGSAENNAPKNKSAQKLLAMEKIRELKELMATNSYSDLDPRYAYPALGAVFDITNRVDKMAALKELCLQLATKDPNQAMTAAWVMELGKLPDDPSEREVLAKVAEQWAAADFQGVFSWAANMPPDEEGRRDLIMNDLAEYLRRLSPEDAARLVTDQPSPESERFENAMTVFCGWAGREYASAAAWAELLPNGPIQDRAKAKLAEAQAIQQQSVGTNPK